VDSHNNIPSVEEVRFPFRLNNIKGKHLPTCYGGDEVITKLSKLKNYNELSEKKRVDKIVINNKEDILNFFKQEFNGFFHVTYMKWYDIIQAYIIHKLREEIGDDKVREIHSYFKPKYNKLNLPIVSGGEKLYEELTGFKFDITKKSII